MPIQDFFKKFIKSEPEDYLEIDSEEKEIIDDQIPIRKEELYNISDVERIQQKLRNGTILIIKIKDLKKKDMNELKKYVEKIKKTVTALNGDIAGIGQDWIIAT